ncbi:Serine/threonine-protein kinase STE7 [Candida viswanathii]|uniref:Serine/threonine-protein kinase STE7 n=1 Tax=Candida viswanathii TaxID=5486 RepID=A0A367Y1D6_9ASCO|nr:Serine/threonine-protein kinase STE7 [Candida viswanathii]
MPKLNRLDSSDDIRQKELPPVPQALPTTTALDQPFMETKSLRRKNFKKLSLDASPVKSKDNLITNETMNIKEPTSLRQKRQRPAPILNLPNSSSSTATATETATTPAHISSSSSSLAFSLQSPGSGVIVSQTLSRPTSAGGIAGPGSSSTSPFNINRSNRNVDPDNEASTDLILSQISNLDLSNMNHHQQRLHQNNHHHLPSRKRQTVISSISPTKSTSSSPLEPKAQLVTDAQSPIATTSSLKLNSKDLLTLKQLGSGNSGSVSKILHIPTQKTMAKKIIHIDLKSVIQTQIIRELRILHECHSPYIIEFYGACLNNNNTIVICMEYCNCGSLDKILPLCDNKQFPTFVLKKLSLAILSGLTYLYTTHKIIHRDIKPNNVLMTHRGEFKLCDFGVSRELTNSLAMADTFVGTSMYMSPERIQGMDYGVKSDVWSTGLMLIELASGLPVWTDDDDEDQENGGSGLNSYNGPEGILDLLQRIVNEDAPTLSNKVNHVTRQPYDKKLCEFIDACLIKDDALRKTPWQLLEDKDGFLKGVEEGLYDKEHKHWAKKIRKLKNL